MIFIVPFVFSATAMYLLPWSHVAPLSRFRIGVAAPSMK